MTTPGLSQPADVAQIAARLTKARADRIAISPISADFPGLDLAGGYAVQRQLRAEAGPLAGWKLGLTSRAKQVQVGVREPVRGFLAAANALDRSLATENEALRPGDLVLSGGLTAAVPVRAGDVVTVTADRLGSVEIGCR